ncbi:MAG TPA: hypothetical protein VMT46_02780 [Anaerolineaceae bacterium]|nr:hypothetical protein [Anaerolineaceae bacterium]
MKTQGSSLRGCFLAALLILVILIFIPIGIKLANPDRTIATPVTPPQVSHPFEQPAHSRKPVQAGLNVVYAETDPSLKSTTLWALAVGHPSQPQKIISLAHKTGKPLSSKVSPDGTQIAVLQIPADSSREYEGTLWLVDLAGAKPRSIASRVTFLGSWSNDSRSFVYGKKAEIGASANPGAALRFELWQTDLSNGESRLMVAMDSARDLLPLGWASMDGRFYLGMINMEGQWSVRGWNPTSGKIDREMALPEGQNIRTLTLSPDGKKLLIEYNQSAQAVLALVDLDGTGFQPLLSESSTGSSPSFTALWSSDSSQLLIANPPGFSSKTFEQLDIASLKSDPIPVEEDLSLLGWSPDRAWIVVQQAGSQNPEICLLNRQTGKMTALAQAVPQSHLSFAGWIVSPG